VSLADDGRNVRSRRVSIAVGRSSKIRLQTTTLFVWAHSYTFAGWSRFEQSFSGGVDTIDPASSRSFAGGGFPTRIELVAAFLDSNDNVVGDVMLDKNSDRAAQSGMRIANDNICFSTLDSRSMPAGEFEAKDAAAVRWKYRSAFADKSRSGDDSMASRFDRIRDDCLVAERELARLKRAARHRQ
jgi:hypothetical protein